MPLINRFMSSPISYLYRKDFEGFLLTVLYLLPALVIAVSFHEAAHAWMAYKMGDPTARNLGRLTLDPLKHISLLGLLVFLFVGYGWGKPVPTNPRNYNNYKKANFLVAIAGVTVNLILSFIFFALYVILIVARVDNVIILNVVYHIVTMNIVLCFFNLIPIPPLDGHHLVSGFIARRSPKFYMLYKQYGYYVLLALLLFTDFISEGLLFILNGVLSAYYAFFGLFL
ncbi:MAG: site-2 protease family protein [Christensenellales bacterium]